MKNLTRPLFLSSLLVLASAVFGIAMPAVDITVSGSSGALAFKGQTNTNGTFATGNLPPGEYVVQFNTKNPSQLKENNYLVVVSAGKRKVSADSLAGEKFGAGGVAMKITVGAGTNISGQIAAGQAVDNRKVKIIKGKRYVWVPGEMGSNLGGRWVEEGSVAARHIQRGDATQLGKWQDQGMQGGIPGD